MKINYWVYLLRWFLYFVGLYALILGWLTKTPVFYGATVLAWFMAFVWMYGKGVKMTLQYNAHWASLKDIQPLKTVYSRESGKEILMGYAYGNMVSIKPFLFNRKEMGHVLVVGPSRAGKGMHITVNLLNWGGSAIVVDMKGDLFSQTGAFRKHVLGHDVFVLNPSGDGHSYDPFTELDGDEKLRSLAKSMMDAASDGDNNAFALRAENALFAALKGAVLLKKPFIPLYRELSSKGCRVFVETLWELGDRKIQGELVDFLSMSPDEYDWENTFPSDKYLNNAWTNMISKMKNFMTDGVIRMTSGNDFLAADLLEKPTTVYLVFNDQDIEYTINVFNAVLTSMMGSMTSKVDRSPGQKFLNVACFFDEAGTLKVTHLPKYASGVAGRGISCITYLQSVKQLETIYGPAGASVILDNCHTKLFYAPEDIETAEYVSSMCGQMMVEDQRLSKGDGLAQQLAESAGLKPRELITATEMMEMPVERCILKSKAPPMMMHRLAPYLLPRGDQYTKMPPPELPRAVDKVIDPDLGIVVKRRVPPKMRMDPADKTPPSDQPIKGL